MTLLKNPTPSLGVTQIPFSKPAVLGNTMKYVEDAILSGNLAGNGPFAKRCISWLEEHTGARKALLTTSCTHALEMAALLLKVKENDEIIMPSFAFPSTANAFVLRGARIVFIDIRPDTMNMDERLIEKAVTRKTKAIVPVHYAGVSCEMDTIMAVAKKHGLMVIEDAAQGVLASYQGRTLGTIGDLGVYSFHETKNITCGEGGALLVNHDKYVARAEVIAEKGTDRSLFYQGKVDKYSWQDIGSSYVPSELNAAFLLSQLENAEKITRQRLEIWNRYATQLRSLAERGCIDTPTVPPGCRHNGHIFYIKAKDLDERNRLIDYLRKHSIHAVFHYVPLHSSKAGKKFKCRFNGTDTFTTRESERLVRLPLYYGMTADETDSICEKIAAFYG